MSKKISAGGKTFTEGETIQYTLTAGESRDFIVVDRSKSNPPGLILQNLNNKRVFAIDAAAVATRVQKLAAPIQAASQAPDSAENVSSTPEKKEPIKPEPKSKSKSKPEPEREPEPEPEPTPIPSGPSEPYGATRKSGGRFFSALGILGSRVGHGIASMGRSVAGVGLRLREKTKLKTAELAAAGFTFERFLIELVFLGAIAISLIDALLWGFSTVDPTLTTRIYAYLALSLLATWAFGLNIFEGIYQFVIIVSFVPIFLIPVMMWGLSFVNLPANIIKVLGVILLAVPYWLVYLRFVLGLTFPTPGTTRAGRMLLSLFTPSKWVNWYFVFISIAALLWFLTMVVVPFTGQVGIGQTNANGEEINIYNPREALEAFTGGISSLFSKVIEDIKGVGVGDQYKKWKNDTLGAYYTGTVEENKEATGIFITDFHVTGKQYDSMPVVAYGMIKARSFVEGVSIQASCYAQNISNKSQTYAGTTDPSVLDNIYIEDQRGVICQFDEGQLPAGKYNLFLVLNFRFETWAYKPYFFMDRGYFVYLKTSGSDPNLKLEIPRRTRTIYTSGPVMIGMDDAIDMPVTLGTNTSNYLPIGVTLDDKPPAFGARGEVIRVHNYTLRLPEAFDIEPNRCTIRDFEKREDIEGYNMYVFHNKVNLNGSYMTLNCNINISKDSTAQILPMTNTPAILTIVATTEYDYRLTKQIPLTVEKTPGATS